MKKLIFLIGVICTTLSLSAQTNTWSGAVNSNWNNAGNWSLGIPTALHDVVIPNGSTVTVNVVTDINSIVVQGTATINIASTLDFAAASSFSSGTTANWSIGALTGGGILTNNGIIHLQTANNKIINGATVLNNAGIISIDDSGDLYITNGVLNNQASGIIDMTADAGNLSYSSGGTHTLNNLGLIKRSTSVGNAQIDCELVNSGTLSVESGNLILSNSAIQLNGGVYNVSVGATLSWNATVNMSGALTGVVNGTISFAGTAAIATTASWNFTGSGFINWSLGTINGGGTLTNNAVISLDTANNKSLNGNTTWNNNGLINIIDSGDLYITSGTLNNQLTGTIDLRADAGYLSYSSGGLHILNNYGLIKKTTTSGFVSIACELHNEGTIAVESGTLNLNNDAITLQGGIYNISSSSFMTWNATVTITGTLTGTIPGEIVWYDNVSVPVAQTATFAFTGSGNINWSSGSLIGGGTLVNQFTMRLTTANNKIITAATTYNNEALIYNQSSGDLYITDGILNNLASGTIDLKADAGNLSYSSGASHILNNFGLIKKTTSVGIVSIECDLINTGTISVQSGTLILADPDIQLNGGTYNVSSGTAFQWQSTVTCSGTLNGLLDGQVVWTNTVSVPVATTINFTGAGAINWDSGLINGGGILTNNTSINLTTANIKSISGLTTVNNNALVTIADSGDLYITDGIFNNQLSGIIDMKADSGNLSYSSAASHILNNAGLIKRTTSGGAATIESDLINTGTISVESGTLNLADSNIQLNGGTYNVATGTTFQWQSTVTCSGTLNGSVNGQIIWTDTVSIPDAATMNFTGSGAISWTNGTVNGAGVLTNNSRINMGTANIKIINGGTTINNNSTMAMVDSGDLYITNGILNNQLSGIIDLQTNAGYLSYSTGASHVLNNFGLIKKTDENGITQILCLLNNSGTIDAQVGTLEITGDFPFTNNADGILSGIATIDLPAPANYTNNGITSPGGSPGTLIIIGPFESEASSQIAVELNGLTPGTQHDVLAISGNAVLNGSVDVVLGFAPALNDTFTIATTSGTITTCGLTATTAAIRSDLEYTFSVGCVNDNSVVLTVIEIVAVPPVATDQSFCEGATVANLEATGTTIQWYAAAIGGPALADVTLLATGIYYVTQTVSGFESDRVAVAVTISTTPQPTAGVQVFNNVATVADLVATGTLIQWYSDAVGGTALAPSTVLATGTYYATQTLNGCESTRLAVAVTVNLESFFFYVDADADGFGAGELVAVQDGPTPPPGYATNNTDCNDNDENVFQNAELFVDADGDNYDSGTATVCYGLTIPAGYVAVSLGTDCDDNDGTIFQSAELFIDADGDNYDAGSATVCYGASIPSGYSDTSNGTDCDDSDSEIFQSVTLFVDADGDGYDNGTAVFCAGDTIPPGYSENTNGSDCDDTDAAIFQSAALFIDLDGDGYDNGTETLCYGTAIPNGYSAASTGTDCDDSNPAIYQSATLFIDADADGYDSGSEVICYGATIPSGYAAVSVGADCDDNNNAVNPAATEIPGNGIDDNCNNQIDEGNSGVTTVIFPSQCGTTLTTINTLIGAVAVPNGTAYRFKVVNNSNSAEQTIVRVVANFRLTMLASYDYGTSYAIAVEVQQNGVWAGLYGSSCNIATPDITVPGGAAQITPSQCGITLPTISTLIATTSLQGVTGYRFRITNLTDLTGPNQVQVLDRGIHWFSLMMLQRYNYGTTYAIEVAMKTNGAYSAYGNPCAITTPAVPSLTQCGGNVATVTTNITTASIAQATMYRFEVTNQSTNVVTTVDRTINYFTLSQVAGYVVGVQYSVRVAVMTANTWSPFGNSCIITAPGIASRPADEAVNFTSEKFSVIGYPNPYTDRFAIESSNVNGGNMVVKIYDMTGRLIDENVFTADELQVHQFGDNYPSGVYNVIVSHGDAIETLRMIKR